MALPLSNDPDELQHKAKELLVEAQNTGDLKLRDELLRLCEKVLQEAAAARHGSPRND